MSLLKNLNLLCVKRIICQFTYSIHYGLSGIIMVLVLNIIYPSRVSDPSTKCLP